MLSNIVVFTKTCERIVLIICHTCITILTRRRNTLRLKQKNYKLLYSQVI